MKLYEVLSNKKKRVKDSNNQDDNQSNQGGQGGYKGNNQQNNQGGNKDKKWGISKVPVNLKSPNVYIFRYITGSQKKNLDFNLNINQEDFNNKGGREIESYNSGFPIGKNDSGSDVYSNYSAERNGNDIKIRVTLTQGSVFAMQHEQEGSWRVYTPWTGPFFYLVVKEGSGGLFNPDYSINFKPGDVFSQLLYGNEQIKKDSSKTRAYYNPMKWITLPKRIGQNIRFASTNVNMFNPFYELVDYQMSWRSQQNEKYENFDYRVGDILTGLGDDNKYIIVEEFADVEKGTRTYILLNQENKDDPENNIMVLTGIPLKKRGIELLFPPEGRNKSLYVDSLTREQHASIYLKVKDEIQNSFNLGGLMGKGYRERDKKREMPPKYDENKGKGQTQINVEDVVYLSFNPQNDKQFINQYSYLSEKVTEIYAPNGYFIVILKALIKRDGVDRNLYHLYPVNGKEVDVKREIKTQAGANVSNVQRNETAKHKYMTLTLPTNGEGSLEDLCKNRKVSYDKNAYRGLIEKAKAFVKSVYRDNTSKTVRAGDVYLDKSGALIFIAGVKDKGDSEQYTIVPLGSFTDTPTVSSKATNQIRWTSGGDKTIGYGTTDAIPKSGEKSFAETSVRVFTKDQCQQNGIYELAKDYYLNYMPDGTPRLQTPNELPNAFHDNTMKINRQDGVTEFVTQNNQPRPNLAPKPEGGFNAAQPTFTQTQENLDPDNVGIGGIIGELLRTGKLKEGSLVYYDWDQSDKKEIEIFYAYDPVNGNLRLVPHQDFKGSPDGLVHEGGFAGLVPGSDNISIEGFFTNLRSNFYSSPIGKSPRKFKFNSNFEDDFKGMIQDTVGSPFGMGGDDNFQNMDFDFGTSTETPSGTGARSDQDTKPDSDSTQDFGFDNTDSNYEREEPSDKSKNYTKYNEMPEEQQRNKVALFRTIQAGDIIKWADQTDQEVDSGNNIVRYGIVGYKVQGQDLVSSSAFVLGKYPEEDENGVTKYIDEMEAIASLIIGKVYSIGEDTIMKSRINKIMSGDPSQVEQFEDLKDDYASKRFDNGNELTEENLNFGIYEFKEALKKNVGSKS